MAQPDDVNVPQVVTVSGLGVLFLVVLVVALQALYFVSDADVEAEKSTHEMPEVYQQSIAEQQKPLDGQEKMEDGKTKTIKNKAIDDAMTAVVKDLQAKQTGGK